MTMPKSVKEMMRLVSPDVRRELEHLFPPDEEDVKSSGRGTCQCCSSRKVELRLGKCTHGTTGLYCRYCRHMSVTEATSRGVWKGRLVR